MESASWPTIEIVGSSQVRWYTDDPELVWLNDRWGYEEGELDRKTLRFQTRTYVLHEDSHPVSQQSIDEGG
jgi:hypothetical protein